MTNSHSTPDAPLNGAMHRRAAVDTRTLAWVASPSRTVMRKRLHRVGPAEAGQVTSLVRYQPNAHFPSHDHPDGEEILVLDGVFSDEHGDWPAGTYLLNPEGFRHAPFSRDGCLLFVKLRQYGGTAREHRVIATGLVGWQPSGSAGIELKPLYAQADFRDSMRLERWAPGTAPGLRSYPDGVEYLLLKGSLQDEADRYDTHAWLRLPPGAEHRPRSSTGCEFYLKLGGVRDLKSTPR